MPSVRTIFVAAVLIVVLSFPAVRALWFLAIDAVKTAPRVRSASNSRNLTHADKESRIKKKNALDL